MKHAVSPAAHAPAGIGLASHEIWSSSPLYEQ
jgi:hypothetical protein